MSAPDVAREGGFRPLEGTRIVEFSGSIAGPHATMILAQLGADVIKVESPGGDDSRAWPPHVGDRSVVYRQMCVGKRGIVVDLKRSEGVAVALALAATAAVVLQTMRPGVADRIGIGQQAVRARNPDVVYYDMSAFGDGAVGRDMPGYDPMVQAYTGIMEMTGYDGSPPARCAPSIIDLGTSQWIAMGVLAAVLARQRGQRVRSLETALVDTAFSVVSYQATAARLSGERPPKAGSGNPIAAPYQCYRARDGYLLIAAPNQRLWLTVVGVLGAPQLADDPRFGTVGDRSRNLAALEEAMTAMLAGADVDDWITRFAAAGVPVTRVCGLEEAVVGPIAGERGTFVESDGVPLVRLPWRVDGEPIPWGRAAPRLGEHTREVLREIGYDERRIAALVDCGAVQALDTAAG